MRNASTANLDVLGQPRPNGNQSKESTVVRQLVTATVIYALPCHFEVT